MDVILPIYNKNNDVILNTSKHVKNTVLKHSVECLVQCSLIYRITESIFLHYH